MNGPHFGEFNLGALAGAVVGSVGGLFAIGLANAIIGRNLRLLFATPNLGLVCWVIGGIVGWLFGGQLGPRLGMRFRSQRAEVVGGALAGLVPITLIAAWGWYLVSHY
jgi:hypothetical protein